MENKIKNQKPINLIIAMLFVSIVFVVSLVMAQENELRDKLGNPGITPDSSFYFLDRMFDWTQNAESRANEKVAEVFTMARDGKPEEAQVAMKHYEGAMEKRRRHSEGNEKVAEGVATQATTHLIVLANVLEQVPGESKQSIQHAMDVSIDKRDEAINTLTDLDSFRGEVVARETLGRIMTETSTQAQEGLVKAFNFVGNSEYSEEQRRKG